MSLERTAETPRPSLVGLHSPARHTFAIAGLVVFLVGLLFVKSPVSSYIVQAVLARRVIAASSETEAPPLDTPHLESLLLDGDAIRNAMREADLAPEHSAEIDAAVARLREQIQCEFIPNSTSDVQVRIKFAGADLQQSKKFVDSLGREFLAAATLAATEQPKRSVREERTHRWQVRETRHYEKRARHQVDNFLDEFFSDLGARETSVIAADNAPPVNREPNPEWSTRRRHLEQLTADRAMLATKRTANHPQVHELDTEIALAEQRLNATPQFITADEPGSDISETSPNSDSQIIAMNAAALAATRSAYQELRRDYEQAVVAREQAEEAVAREEANTADQASPTVTWLMQPAHIAGQVGGRPSAVRFLLVLVISVAGGFAAVQIEQKWTSSPIGAGDARQANRVWSTPNNAASTDSTPRRRRAS